jgi:hypothetical protein
MCLIDSIGESLGRSNGFPQQELIIICLCVRFLAGLSSTFVFSDPGNNGELKSPLLQANAERRHVKATGQPVRLRQPGRLNMKASSAISAIFMRERCPRLGPCASAAAVTITDEDRRSAQTRLLELNPASDKPNGAAPATWHGGAVCCR